MKEKIMKPEEKLSYDDIELKYNKGNKQFYFLEVSFAETANGQLELEYYDINNGAQVSREELKGYAHFDKSILFKNAEDFSISVGNLQKIYAKITSAKKDYGQKEEKEDQEKGQQRKNVDNRGSFQPIKRELEITEETKYSYDELLLTYNDETTDFWFLVGKVDNGVIRNYDAINGGLVEKRDLKGYQVYNKEAVLEPDVEYTPSQLETLNSLMNTQKVNYTFKSEGRKRK